jgi:hypothetical protein
MNLKGGVADMAHDLLGRRVVRETGNSRQRLGAWASSEEEPKPTRGSRGTRFLILGDLEREDPEARL